MSKTIGALQFLDSNRNICIPGYLKLNANTDFTDFIAIGQGGTAKVFVAKIKNPTLSAWVGLTEAAIKHVHDSDDQEFRLEVAILGYVFTLDNFNFHA